MQGIAYKIDGRPYITWPVYTAIFDDEGNPTGKQTSNIQELIDQLPDDIEYKLIDEIDADAYFTTNKSIEQQIINIKQRLDKLDEKYPPTMRTINNAIAGDEVAINIVKQKNALHESDKEILSLRAELAKLETTKC